MQRATCRSVVLHASRKLSLSDAQIGELLSEFEKAWQQCDEDVVTANKSGVGNRQQRDGAAGNGHVTLWGCEAERHAQLYQE